MSPSSVRGGVPTGARGRPGPSGRPPRLGEDGPDRRVVAREPGPELAERRRWTCRLPAVAVVQCHRLAPCDELFDGRPGRGVREAGEPVGPAVGDISTDQYELHPGRV